jgi:hypothetical protein
MKIIDHTGKKDKTPIELKYCLQFFFEKGRPIFGPEETRSTESLIRSNGIYQIERIGSYRFEHKDYDLIRTLDGDESELYWIGNWNDGIQP